MLEEKMAETYELPTKVRNCAALFYIVTENQTKRYTIHKMLFSWNVKIKSS